MNSRVLVVGLVVVVLIALAWLGLRVLGETAAAPVLIDRVVAEPVLDTPASDNNNDNQTNNNPRFVNTTLAGTMWELQSVTDNSDESISGMQPANSFVLLFHDVETFSATTDCNTLYGQCELTPTGIIFSNIASTKMFCPEGSFEQMLTKQLTQKQIYQISESLPPQLTLRSEAGSLSYVGADLRLDQTLANPSEETADGVASVIGMTVTEAEAYAAANNTTFRIGSVDGVPQPVTMDYRPGRITADVEAGIVVGYTVE